VSYAAYTAAAWFRYGRTKPAAGEAADVLLDTFMPRYEVSERHNAFVAAPAEVTLSAAKELDLESSVFVRAIFKARERILRSARVDTARPRGLIANTTSSGWGVLAERPDREIVLGCATKPWEANPVFRTLRPDEFAGFNEPGYVKIAWTLRADPAAGGCVFRTETRAIATDAVARKRFRRYWALVSPGIILIRFAMLPGLKAAAERKRREIAA
jgi:hypothetical protein